jgi:hypothetical protein
MADPARRRRMSRNISLVLLGSLPGLAWCAGCVRERADDDEAETEESRTSGGYSRSRTRVHYVPVGGRSSFLSSRPSSGPGPGHSPNISRGGFGSTGHGAVGG